MHLDRLSDDVPLVEDPTAREYRKGKRKGETRSRAAFCKSTEPGTDPAAMGAAELMAYGLLLSFCIDATERAPIREP